MAFGHKSGGGDHSQVKSKAIAAGVPSFGAAGEEERQQFAKAVEVAAELAQYVGRPGDPVSVAISGNANAGFAPGGGAQTITVTVTNTQ
jgi:uncharacterized protein (DUF58 family)